jgi:hypothetical protein
MTAWTSAHVLVALTVAALASPSSDARAIQDTKPATPPAQTPPAQTTHKPAATAPSAQQTDKSAAAQTTDKSAASGKDDKGDKPPLKPEELDQIVAPIALYPDDVLAQVFMASTYPVEIVQAYRWMEQNKSLKGDALAKALEAQTWDASVKSLINVPDVLKMLNDKLDWTVKLGDAFLAGSKELMEAVQRLRAKAHEAGNLKTTEQQKVVVDQQTIVIQSTNPDVIYVPTYDPVVVYGAWPYPAYPPYYYYPPGYVAGTAAVSFGLGVAAGLAWGYAFGGCNWHGGDVNIDIDRNVNRNTNIDRNKINANNRSGKFQHDPAHRKGQAYRDNKTASQYGRGGNKNSAASREQYRGRDSAQSRPGASTSDRAGAGGSRANTAGTSDRSSGASNRASGASDRSASGSQNRAGNSSPSNRSSSGSSSRGGSAFSGSGGSGSSARASSSRGAASRGASGGGARGGGGGRRR